MPFHGSFTVAQGTTKLFVGNLSYDVTSSDLQKMLSEHGTVTSAEVISDRTTGRSRGFGFVEMASEAEAEAAIAALNGQQQGGRTLTDRPFMPACAAAESRRRSLVHISSKPEACADAR